MKLSHTDMKAYLHAHTTLPFQNIWIRVVFNYRYNPHTYHKFPIDLWEDVCEWVHGGKRNHILRWTDEILRSFSNLNHSCPYSDVLIDVERIPIDKAALLMPLIPSGRYRVDVHVTRGKNHNVSAMVHIFFGVSDNRVEVF